MRRSRWVTINVVVLIIAGVIFSNTTVPVVAATTVQSKAKTANIKAGEDDVGDFIHDVAVAAYEGAAAGLVEGAVAGFIVGAEAGAVVGFYAGAVAGAVGYWFGDDQLFLSKLPAGKVPATALD